MTCSRCDAGVVHAAASCDWWLSAHPQAPAQQLRRLTTRSKYRAVPACYRYQRYASTAEADYAARLDAQAAAGAIRSWRRATPLEVVPSSPGRAAIHYVPDFAVVGVDGSEWVAEVKGVWTAVARLKLRLLRQRYPDMRVIVVRNGQESVYGEKQPRKRRAA